MGSDRRAESADPALTTDIVAAYMGTGTRYVVEEIEADLLEADNLARNGERANYRVYYSKLVKYLRARKWSRIPKSPEDLFAVAGRRAGDGPSA